MNDEELIGKVTSYPKCDDGCMFRHHMADVNNPNYKIVFCGFEMGAIAKGTYCAYYKRREG